MARLKKEVEFLEDVEGVEAHLSPSQMSDAVVYATDWTTETIISQMTKGNIDLNPRFQRRDAWSPRRKCRYIESLVLGLPIPQIVLAEMKDGKGKYIVLDGKQRLLTLLQFTGAAEGKNNKFRLRDMDVRTDLNGQSYDDILGCPKYRDDINQFHNQTIRSVIIRNWPNIDFLYLVFVRLNTGSVSLSPQELRQACLPGPFVDFVDDEACKSTALKSLLGIEEPDFRMRDVELLVRYLGFAFFLSDYSGNLKDFLDTTCQTFNAEWASRGDAVRQKIEVFEKSIQAAIRIFGRDKVARKWIGAEFQPRLNRAVLDVISFYFSDERIRDAAIQRRTPVVEGFKALCEHNEDFRNSIETTTKSLSATGSRFSLWGQKLRETLGLKFSIPESDGGRITFSGFWPSR